MKNFQWKVEKFPYWTLIRGEAENRGSFLLFLLHLSFTHAVDVDVVANDAKLAGSRDDFCCTGVVT